MEVLPAEKRNPMLDKIASGEGVDHLYHIGLDTSQDLSCFADTRFVVMGGSRERSLSWAESIQQQLRPGDPSPVKAHGKTERYTMYKVGPIISVSHGMGMPSIRILLHELAKLLRHAGARDVVFIRVGTCGGIGVDPGTVVITDQALNGKLEPEYELIELGETKRYPSTLDKGLVEELHSTAQRIGVKSIIGSTVVTDDFYEGQARLDGALKPGYTEEDKVKFLHRAQEKGVRNFEMEGLAFASFCLQAGIRGAVICAVLVNRLEGDQVRETPARLGEFSLNAQRVVTEYMLQELGRPPAKKART